MQVGRVTFGSALTAEGSGQGAAKTVLGGAVLMNLLPWVIGAVVLVVVLLAVSRTKKI